MLKIHLQLEKNAAFICSLGISGSQDQVPPSAELKEGDEQRLLLISFRGDVLQVVTGSLISIWERKRMMTVNWNNKFIFMSPDSVINLRGFITENEPPLPHFYPTPIHSSVNKKILIIAKVMSGISPLNSCWTVRTIYSDWTLDWEKRAGS